MIETVKQIAREAGDIVMSHYKSDDLDIRKKRPESIGSEVTKADKEADAYIRKKLGEEFPKDQILSEENEEEHQDYSKRTWMVDPIDGTLAFIKQMDCFSVSIGLAENGKPLLGVVFFPSVDEMFYAEKGKGAFLEKDGETTKVEVSRQEDLSQASMSGDEPYKTNDELKKIFKDLEYKEIADNPGPYTNKVIGIAAGRADFFILEKGMTSKWDSCGSDIIIKEAGGKLTDEYGEDFDYSVDGTEIEEISLMSNSFLHQQLVDFIASSQSTREILQSRLH